jgi:hypothetical protein
MMPSDLKRPLPLAVCFFLAVTFGHFLSLPILITWDGHDYIDLAGVLGSDRFPADWRLIRTPLLPLGLKLSFSLFGTGALAAVLVPLAMGVLGCLLVASSVRRLAGDAAAAGSLVLLALYPALIVFEHAILTETGTFFFLALALRLSLWAPETPRAAWLKALSLGLVLGAGYYWRQTLLSLAPWFALLFVLCPAPQARGRRQWAPTAAQALLVAVLPWGLEQPWLANFDRQEMTRLDAMVLRSFVVRQAVLPPEDDRVAASVRADYRATLARAGSLSGIPWHKVPEIAIGVTSPWEHGGSLPWFGSIVLDHPGRYVRGVGRTLLFYAGFDAAENEVKGYRDTLLSPGVRGSVIGKGPERVEARVKREFAQSTGPGLLQAVLRRLAGPFDALLIACNLATLGLLAVSLVRRDRGLLALSGTPAVFALLHAALLLSFNRFMVPIYPITLACGMVAGFKVGGFLRRVRAGERASA